MRRLIIIALCAGGCAGNEDAGPPDARPVSSADASPRDAGPGGSVDAPPAAMLAVTSVSPGQGPVAGGSQVVISGRGFTSGATVTFGSNAGVSPTLISEFQIKVTTPATSGPGKVAVTVKLAGGTMATLQAGFEYVMPKPNVVDWCNIQWPAATGGAPGVALEPIFGQVYAAGCTEGDKKCDPLTAQLGYGPANVDPSTKPSDFTWLAASYNASHTGDDNDEYSLAPTIANAGTYGYAYRFSRDGNTWTYCDLDGSGNGVQAAQLGKLTIAAQKKSIGWCALKWPAELPTIPAGPTDPVFGQLFVDGCTPGDRQCAGVTAAVGYGPTGVDPSDDPSLYTWVAATYNATHMGDDNDEYQAKLNVTKPGTYGYAYRFSVDNGSTWSYCDLDGSDNGFSTSQLGRLTVGTPKVDWCGLQSPSKTSTSPGVATETIYGQAYVAGCTDGDSRCDKVTAQLGYGSASADPATYTWVAAAYNVGHTGDGNDEYEAQLTVANEGTYAYAYRFSLDGGTSWTVCDLDGSANGVEAAQLGALTVAKPVLTVDWCTLQWPLSTSAKVGQETEPIFGQLYVAGCTDGSKRCDGVTAQVGYGAANAEPSTYTWAAAAYNASHTEDNNDEYSATLKVTAAGTYGYAFRFSRDGGTTWSTCDGDGSANGFDKTKVGQLTVAPLATPIGWCNLQSPTDTATRPNVATETIFGRVYVEGCTAGASQCDKVIGQLGYGRGGVDPQESPSSYLWRDATYNTGHIDDNNDEYQATFTPTETGIFSYAYRFSVDGGDTWTYCDADGSTDGVQADQLGEVTVTGLTVAWCNIQYPATLSVAKDMSTGPMYGQVLVTGCTEGDKACTALKGQLGFGARAADPQATPSSYTWVEATYNEGHTGDDNDEWQAAFTPTMSGSFGYAFRFSGDDGFSWTYCDTSGSPFASADVGKLDVP